MVAFVIVPLFALANAGVVVDSRSASATPVAMGAFFGLVVGKPVGVFGTTWLATRFGLAPRPTGSTSWQLLGASVMAGIGFTMSLFVGNLALGTNRMLEDQAKLGVLAASVVAAVLGMLLLRLRSARQTGDDSGETEVVLDVPRFAPGYAVLPCPVGAALRGQSLAELDIRKRFEVSVIGRWPAGADIGVRKLEPVAAGDPLREGDTLLVAGAEPALAAFERFAAPVAPGSAAPPPAIGAWRRVGALTQRFSRARRSSRAPGTRAGSRLAGVHSMCLGPAQPDLAELAEVDDAAPDLLVHEARSVAPREDEGCIEGPVSGRRWLLREQRLVIDGPGVDRHPDGQRWVEARRELEREVVRPVAQRPSCDPGPCQLAAHPERGCPSREAPLARERRPCLRMRVQMQRCRHLPSGGAGGLCQTRRRVQLVRRASKLSWPPTADMVPDGHRGIGELEVGGGDGHHRRPHLRRQQRAYRSGSSPRTLNPASKWCRRAGCRGCRTSRRRGKAHRHASRRARGPGAPAGGW